MPRLASRTCGAPGPDLTTRSTAEAFAFRERQADTLEGTTMATKEDYQARFAAQLKDWDARVDRLSEKLHTASADARKDYEAELDRLRGQRSAVQGMLAELGRRGEKTWGDIEIGAERAWAEMNKAMERLTSRLG